MRSCHIFIYLEYIAAKGQEYADSGLSKDELKMLSSHCATTNDWTAVNKGKSDSDLVGVIVLDFFFIEFLTVDSAPGIDDVG